MPASGTSHRSLLAGTGELQLRVRGSGLDGQLIRIRSPKCTVGSAAGCTLRLHAPGIEALHCWILRGERGCVVRRLRGAALLNGAAFHDSLVRGGDSLRLGAVELQFIDGGAVAPHSAALPPAAAREPGPETAALETRLTAANDRIARLEVEAKQGFQSSIVAADRADQLRDALAAAHLQLAEACRELAAAQETMTRQSAEIDQYRHELRDVEAEETELAQEVWQARDKAESAKQAGAALEAELAAAQQQLSIETQQWQTERQLLERRLQQREAELDALRSSSTAQTGCMTVALNETANPLDPAVAEAEGRVAALERELVLVRQELEGARHALGGQSVLQERLAERESELAQLANDLRVAEQRNLAADEQSRRQEELESRTRKLAQQEADLVERVARVVESKQQLTRDRETLDAERQLFATEQAAATSAHGQESQLEMRTSELERHIAAANTRLLELEELRAQLGGERAALDERGQRLAQRQHALEEQEAGFQERWLLCEQRREQTDQALSKLNDQEREIAAQRAVLESSQRELAARAADLATQAQRLADRAAEIERREAQPAAANSPAADADPHTTSGEVNVGDADASEAGGRNSDPNEPRSVTMPWNPDELVIPADAAGQENAAEQSLPSREQIAAAFEAQRLGTPTAADNIHDSNNVALLVGRLVRAGLWRGDETPAAGEAASEVAPAAEAKPAPTAPAPAPADEGVDEEDSIEMYMSRLLKRVRGDAPAAPAASASPPAELPSPKAVPAVPSEVPAQEELSAAEYVPRSAAPELPTDLTVMRELANDAARSAIDRHVRKHTGRQATARLVSAGLTLFSSVLLGYWAWQTHSVQASAGAVIGVGVGAYWLLAAVRRLGQAMRLNRPQPGADVAVHD